ncbi:LysR substrate-binding domain-containing protein [Paraburkholderia caledonica]|uniref:DNA-binding transcriptional LysR family regulator n=1 Tax=Paraburkholderia caledonica TaxID=134536 RepID=A0AB73IRM0_9BURK|nr:DNA-binding transcriptional LysR family regulator [Paraburkholderia caledonica]
MKNLVSRLKLRHFSVLLAISRLGSMQKAADALNIGQSAVSKSIAELEETVGAQLIDRDALGAKPTVAGQVLIRHGEVIATAIQRATDELAAVLRGEAGQLNVGIFGPLTWWDVAAKAIADFRNECPRVKISVTEGPMDRLLGELGDGALDVVIGRLSAIYERDNFDVQILQQDTPQFVCRREHPLLKEETVQLEELVRYPWILPAPPSLLRMQVEHMVRDTIGTLPHTISSLSYALNFALVSQTDAIALISECTRRRVTEAFGVATVPFTLAVSLGPLVSVTRTGHGASPFTSAFQLRIKDLLRDADSAKPSTSAHNQAS